MAVRVHVVAWMRPASGSSPGAIAPGSRVPTLDAGREAAPCLRRGPRALDGAARRGVGRERRAEARRIVEGTAGETGPLGPHEVPLHRHRAASARSSLRVGARRDPGSSPGRPVAGIAMNASLLERLLAGPAHEPLRATGGGAWRRLRGSLARPRRRRFRPSAGLDRGLAAPIPIALAVMAAAGAGKEL